MLELDDATRRALSQRYGPTPDAKARVLAELRGTLGGPVGPEGEGGPGSGAPPSDGGQLVWIAKICAATASLTGAGLLVLKLGASVVAGGDARESAPVATEAKASAPAAPPPSSNAPEARTGAEPELPTAPAKVAAPVQAPTKRHEAGSSLAAEIALLDAAKRISSSDPEAALIYLERHRKEFPIGVLAPEREALHVEVSCALGREPKNRYIGMSSNKSGD